MGVIYHTQILRLEGCFEGQGLGLAEGGRQGPISRDVCHPPPFIDATHFDTKCAECNIV